MRTLRLPIPINLSFFGGGGGGGFRGSRRQGRRQQGNTPMDNRRQNEQFDAVARALGLSKDQRAELHRAISGQGLGFRELMDFARDYFGMN